MKLATKITHAISLLLALISSGAPLLAATFGRPIIIGGQAADLALDEGRGVLYIANFTGNRIEVMSTDTGVIQTSINVSPQPGSIALSPDRRWLLVAHFGNFATPNAPRNSLTLINLETNQRQIFSLTATPLSVAFGADGNALVATSSAFLILDPVTGLTTTLSTITELALKTLPLPFNNYPQNVVASTSVTTRDHTRIYGVLQRSSNDSDVLVYRYDVGRLLLTGARVSTPALGPRTISTDANGSNILVGWALLNENFFNVSQFPNPSGTLNIGGHVIDSARNIIYAQMNEAGGTSTTGGGSGSGSGTGTGAGSVSSIDQPKVLQILDADNLTVRERVQLPENLSGKAILSANGNTMYALSESGVMILPVGDLARQRKVVANVEDLVFRGNFCDRRTATQQFVIQDTSGQNTDFSVSNIPAGIRVEPISGVTPAVITVSVDPLSFSNTRGTSSRTLTINSAGSILVSSSLRLLINSREPDQRGTSVNVPGRLVDILADPSRDRFFIIRQDNNSVLVFDGSSYQQIATLRTGNTPTQLAISFDRRSLLVGSDNSQVIYVYSLDTLQQLPSIRMPVGHYPRSIASAAGATLVASRVAGPQHKISRVDFSSRTATELQTLDTFENNIDIDTVLLASPNGARIMGASKDGTTLLFDGNSNSFVAARRDTSALSGAYAASSFDQFVVGNFLLNASLVPIRRIAPDSQASFGFSFVDATGFRVSAGAIEGPGTIQRIAFPSGSAQIGTRIVESPLQSNSAQPFIRTLAPLFSRNSIVVLTVSGFTVLPWTYDAAVTSPRISRVTNLADGTSAVAPGSLVRIEGSDLSPINQVSRERPLPTALGESCITVNGLPIPLIFVSNREINAQIPFEVAGNTTLILRTPGGISDNFNLSVQPTAPSIFRSLIEGIDTPVATIVNGRNGLLATNSNPLKRNDSVVIYLTGMGQTTPPVPAGLSAPSDPLARSLVEPAVSIGGVEVPVTFAGLTPGEVGVYQINANILRWVPTGFNVPLEINQGGAKTTLSVRVIE
ncbi:MAG: hypothetical protein K7J46_12330 [Bryobacter sp.]|nr:hypothetical protein [Bryobacter sp. CoA8 C33]